MGMEEHAASVVLGLEDVGGSHVAVVGGKGAQLGELSRIEGVRVPPGFVNSGRPASRLAWVQRSSVDASASWAPSGSIG